MLALVGRAAWILLVSAGLSACARGGEGGPTPQAQPASVVVEEEPAPEPPARVEPDESGGQSEDEPEPVFEPATRGQGNCEVTVSALLEAEEYRGSGPMTPALEAALAANPDHARMHRAESHGDHHIQCHYEIRLGHRPADRFSWREVHNNTLRDKTPALCLELAEEVAEHVIESTKQCTDFDAGAYWGYVLEPIP
jgi:hypothetical protein